MGFPSIQDSRSVFERTPIPLDFESLINSPQRTSRSIRQGGTMLRQSLARSAWRTGRRAAAASRAFATTPRRSAEVELTIGKHLLCVEDRQLELELVLTRLQMERRSRSKVWPWSGGVRRCGSVDADIEASRLGSDPGLRKGRSYCP